MDEEGQRRYHKTVTVVVPDDMSDTDIDEVLESVDLELEDVTALTADDGVIVSVGNCWM